MSAKKTRPGFDALVNNTAMGIVVVDASGDIVLINDFALGQFGFERNEVVGKKIELLIPQRFAVRHQTLRKRNHEWTNLSRSMGIGLELYALKKDKTEFPVEIGLSDYKESGEDYTIAFICNISLRKATEELMLNLYRELEEKVANTTQALNRAQANEKELVELKSRFVALASGEFRSILSTIQSSTYLVRQYAEASDQDTREKHLNRITSAVNSITDLLNDFLSVQKTDESQFRIHYTEININEHTRSVIRELSPVMKKGQYITYTHTGDEYMPIDVTLYNHIIVNLLSNAIKFSEEEQEILLSIDITNGNASIIVKDHGIGMSAEEKEHLFEPFYRGEGAGRNRGLGLGLHIVSRYVELMNGKIKCNSEPAKGTEFTINFKT